VPENLALGTTLAAGKGSVALLAAIFVSNFPEALVGARTMRQNGWSTRLAVGTWTAVAALLAATTIAGASLLGGLEGAALGFVLAFAGGAVLASLADTVFPKAFTDGGPYVALATAAGFLVAFELGVV
jgi:ZIP family zinc transporter